MFQKGFQNKSKMKLSVVMFVAFAFAVMCAKPAGGSIVVAPAGVDHPYKLFDSLELDTKYIHNSLTAAQTIKMASTRLPV